MPSAGEVEASAQGDHGGSGLKDGHVAIAAGMSYHAGLLGQPDGFSGEAAVQASNLIRAIMELGASPGVARALRTEVLSPPRVTAAAARCPRFGARRLAARLLHSMARSPKGGSGCAAQFRGRALRGLR